MGVQEYFSTVKEQQRADSFFTLELINLQLAQHYKQKIQTLNQFNESLYLQDESGFEYSFNTFILIQMYNDLNV